MTTRPRCREFLRERQKGPHRAIYFLSTCAGPWRGGRPPGDQYRAMAAGNIAGPGNERWLRSSEHQCVWMRRGYDCGPPTSSYDVWAAATLLGRNLFVILAMIQDNAREELFFSAWRTGTCGVRVDRASKSGNSRELPSASVVPLLLNSDAGGEQAAKNVSHSQRDEEEIGRIEAPRGIEEHRNVADGCFTGEFVDCRGRLAARWEKCMVAVCWTMPGTAAL